MLHSQRFWIIILLFFFKTNFNDYQSGLERQNVVY